jgi:hypothetical protein
MLEWQRWSNTLMPLLGNDLWLISNRVELRITRDQLEIVRFLDMDFDLTTVAGSLGIVVTDPRNVALCEEVELLHFYGADLSLDIYLYTTSYKNVVYVSTYISWPNTNRTSQSCTTSMGEHTALFLDTFRAAKQHFNV